MSNIDKISSDLESLNLEDLSEEALKQLGNEIQTAYDRLLQGLDYVISDLLAAGQDQGNQVVGNISPIIEQISSFASSNLQQYGSQLEAKKLEFKKLADFKANSKKYFQGKENELTDRKKQVGLIMTSIKGVLTNLKPKTIASMKVTGGSKAEIFWKKIFTLLYDEKEEIFNWSIFKKKSLEKDNGQDFQKRIAQFDVENIREDQLKIVEFLKDDKEIQEWAGRDPQGELVLDIFEWLDYIPTAASQYDELRASQAELKKIKKDAEERYVKLETTEFELKILENLRDFSEKLLNFCESGKKLVNNQSISADNSNTIDLAQLQNIVNEIKKLNQARLL